MRNLSSLGCLLLISISLAAQSPHGDALKNDCSDCHTTDNWKVDRNTIRFRHSATGYELEGQHDQVACRSCHPTLNFSKARPECMFCHSDVHEQTLGFECNRCHTPRSWIVENVTALHQASRFPLVGPHITAQCYDCHPSASLLRFDPLGIECFDCHSADYQAASAPNHVAAGYSTDCSECHLIDAFSWSGADFNHSFFPLTQGHDINDCAACHKDGIYINLPTDCYYCHQDDFESAEVPNHITSGFPTDCAECHSLQPGWKPADFRQHDGLYFPVYSGEHNGEWGSCTDCHLVADDYSKYSCTACHEHNQGDMDDEHNEVGGYVYLDDACLACHPTGSAEGGFNHDLTPFPLTGAHRVTECAECHSQGYTGTTTICYDCHTAAYEQSLNPSHPAIGIPTECSDCHSTEPDWVPATFGIHNDFYPLIGAHASIAANCADCHNGDYNNTPESCYGCHTEEYEQATDPDHLLAQFSTDCENCHTPSAWTPSTFNHDAQYFPIYSGKHQGTWASCSECHTMQGNYTSFSCVDCHEHNQAETDPEHEGIGGYTYESNACFACHPTGEATGGFDHNNTGFPLTGAHAVTACLECHANGYSGTTTVCSDCHDNDFNQSTNPNHLVLAIPTTCEQCHTTSPGWAPATFPIHNSFYLLEGAHVGIANDCAICHAGNYNSTPNSCFGCHEDDYNQTTDPPHLVSQFSHDCETCHTQTAWVPSTFDHDNQYFPIYSGEHQGEWASCSECHTNPSNYGIFSCIDCHEHNQADMDDEHQGVSGYSYNSQACYACHPTGQGGGFDHNSTNFPLTGAHSTTGCLECHANGYAGTTMICGDCHADDFNQSANPDHIASGIPNTCEDCHTTNPGWAPATFPIHNNFWTFQGAHLAIADDCDACHSGNYTSTPNTCYGCHQAAYNQTTNPPHLSAGFPTDCELCHTQNVWVPSTFDHDGQYFPIYSGTHAGEWQECSDCHTDPTNFSVFSCLGCHDQGETGREHEGVSGYSYNSNACFSCHPTGTSGGSKTIRRM